MKHSLVDRVLDNENVRCFPHVVNLAVQAVLSNITAEMSPDVAEIYEGSSMDALATLMESPSLNPNFGPSNTKDVVLLIRDLL